MASNPHFSDRPRILVVGGGYVGLYVAHRLQKQVKDRGGIVTLVDPLPYMTYQPFLPEVRLQHRAAPRDRVPPQAPAEDGTDLRQGHLDQPRLPHGHHRADGRR